MNAQKGPVSTESHRRALPDMVEMIPPAEGQIWELGGVQVKIVSVSQRRLFVCKRPASRQSKPWGSMESITADALAYHELLSGPGSRHALTTD